MKDDLITLCSGCKEQIDTDNDVFYYTRVETVLCENCRIADMEYASTIMLFGPDYPLTSDGPHRAYVTENFAEDMYGEEIVYLEFSHEWIATSGWRGYAETRIKGWVEVLNGWTTGWPDSTVARKIDFNDWCEQLATGDIVPPVNVAVISDRTSNVFSSAIGVFVPEGDVEAFHTWINGELENLRYALT